MVHTHAPDVLGLKLGLVNLMGVCFATLSFRKFKQYFSRGCHASFAFGDFLHTPHSPWPKQQQQRSFCLCCRCQQHTLTSKFLNSMECVCRWSLESPRRGCVTVRLHSSSGMALRICMFYRRRYSFCLTHQVFCPSVGMLQLLWQSQKLSGVRFCLASVITKHT